MKKFSIIIITHEKGNLLYNTLVEVHKQSKDDEIIIIDDGGKDKAFIPPYINAKYLPQKHEGYRISTMRNIGIKEAENDCIVILDADCIPQNNWLKTYKKYYKKNILMCGRIDWKGKTGKINHDIRFKNGKVIPKCNWGYFCFGGNIAFDKKKAIEIGGFDERFDQKWGAEDTDFGIRWQITGGKIIFLYDAGVIHQYHQRKMEGCNDNLDFLQKKWPGIRPEPQSLADALKNINNLSVHKMPTLYSRASNRLEAFLLTPLSKSEIRP